MSAKKERINPILEKHPMRNASPVAAILNAASRSQAGQFMALSSLRARRDQPRRYFGREALEELADSIKQHGLLQPLLVRPIAEELFEIVAGERRFRAAELAGLREIQVVVREMGDAEAAIASAVENLQREDLNAFEETWFYIRVLSTELNMKVEEISPYLERIRKQVQRRGLSHNVMGQPDSQAEVEKIEAVFSQLGRMTWESFVQNRLPILRLPEEIAEALRAGDIEYTKAQAVAKVKDADKRTALLDKVLRNDLSLAEIRAELREILAPVVKSSSFDTRVASVFKQLRSGNLLEAKKKKVESLLKELEAVLKEA